MNEINYLSFIQEVKEHIVRSRYIAARLVNREQLLLYFLVGKRLSEKVAAEKWGAKVIEQIAADLQKELPGLRGFSFTNLKNMRQFADEYSSNALLELATVKVQSAKNESVTNSQLTTGQFEGLTPDLFFGIGFTQHILLLNKCKIWQERLFYMTRTVENHWTSEMLEWQIKTQLYQKQGKTIQNNFGKTLPVTLQQSSTLAFKDEYLLDYINIETDDERVVEKGIVNNIKEFIRIDFYGLSKGWYIIFFIFFTPTHHCTNSMNEFVTNGIQHQHGVLTFSQFAKVVFLQIPLHLDG
jgi:predicted nuclease of restriction endonuclease-like (RecB) superfamily